MPAQRVIALVDDLMAVSRIDSAARASGTTVEYPASQSALQQVLEQEQGGSALLLVGLATTKLEWETLVPFCQSVADEHEVKLQIVAFGPHMDLKLRERAKGAGIGEIWANSRMMTDLPKLLEG